jgi:mono/diheme cytochrome c family protein
MGLVAAVLAPLALAAMAQEKPQAPKPTAAQADFFESRIRPLLVEQCSRCHGPAKQLGGLRLDSREALVKGGGRGSSFTAATTDQSLFMQAVLGKGGLQMPPGAPLKQKQIDDLRQWVAMGAPWPDHTAGAPAGDLWSAKPVKFVAPPKVDGWPLNAANSKIKSQKSKIENPIDAFILAKLGEKGLSPAPPADRRTLIRRVTFDLTGLPPTSAEIANFIGDKQPGAYERVVDRLLASPRYGERWARYWLDLVRYADTNGYERDAEKPNSWRYRDYVINAFNNDKPYDRFIIEQLAGDELPNANEETWTATGFLRLGTWDDEPNDPLEYTYDRLDDLVHSTTTAFLALTVKCARCHDHKFDPLPQRDYYAIAAHFWPGYLRPADRELIGGPPRDKVKFPVLAFTNEADTTPLHLLEKGNAHNPGPVVEPGYLTLVNNVKMDANAPKGSKRLQLAEWIANPANPYTARVLVNRVWQQHFGRGLVSTSDNFGRKGALPTHPELLDWLAAAFVAPDSGSKTEQEGKNAGRQENGDGKDSAEKQKDKNAENGDHTSKGAWSIKKLQRLIVTSTTYKQSSLNPKQAEFEQKDSLNEWLWHGPRTRLDADSLRDAILAVSGRINLQMGGRGFTPTVSKEALEGLSRKGAEWIVSPNGEQNRRSIYLFLKRALIPPLMTVFDFGDTTAPMAQRDVTLSPTQALAMLNNDFLTQQSEAFARRVIKEAGNDPSEQVKAAWRLALGRAPSAKEASEAIAYVANNPAPNAARLPGDLPVRNDLTLWLRADGVTTKVQDGKLVRWEDLSGKGNHASISQEANRPTLLQTPPNIEPNPAGLKVNSVQFGNGQYLNVYGQPITGQQFTIIAVANDTGNGSHREIISNWRRKDNIGTAIFLGTTGADTVRFTDSFAPAGRLTEPGKMHILTAVSNMGQAAVYQNRESIATIASGLTPRKTDGQYVIGTQGDINGEYWNGEIAEILVWDRALTDAERTQVWDYLSNRYGIAKPLPPIAPGLVSLCRILFNLNEFIFVD